MATRVLVSPPPSHVICVCGHTQLRHFVSWERKAPGACMVPLCECRSYREVKRG
jgi:hypothetical protein